MTSPAHSENASLTTAQGHRIHAEISLDWELGIARYRAAEHHGTFSIGFDSGHYGHEYCQERSIDLTYGVAVESPFRHRHEDRPTVNRVTLAGRAIYHPADMDEFHYWLNVTRDGGNDYHSTAPRATRSRTADTVRTLTRHFLARPWIGELIEAHDRHHSQYRLSRHRDAIDALEPKLADLARQCAEERAGLARQRAILQSIPVPEDEFSEPAHVLAV